MAIPDWGIEVAPVIAIICFLVGQAVKLAPINKDWIPVICGVVGGGLGVLAMKLMPDFPAHDILTAIAIGIVSGWASVGLWETLKNITIKIPAAWKKEEAQPEDPEPEPAPTYEEIRDEFKN